MTTAARLLALAIILTAAGWGWYQFGHLLNPSGKDDGQTARYVVKRRTLEDRAVERGTVESQNTVFGKCEAPGRTKITFIVPEGTYVKKGDKVAEFETTEIDQEIQTAEVALNEAKGKLDEAEQTLAIQKNENDTNIASAILARDIAEIDLKKYEEGDFVAEQADLERAIKEAEAALEKVRDEKNNVQLLVKKGYRTPQQLREIQLRETTFQFQVERDTQKLLVLETFDKRKKLIEFSGKLAEATLKLERAKQTAESQMKKGQAAVENAKAGVDLVTQQLADLRAVRDKCTLHAEQDGTVAYANERWFDASDRIREGTEMYPGRAVYFLPDMTRMQVKANVHESVVDRIKVGQKATIRLDAFSDRKLVGHVSSVAGMAASTYSNVQNYETIIVIDELPTDLAIKPGMTAEVDILVGSYPSVICVPVGAVTEHFGQSYVYAQAGGEYVRKTVQIGRITHSFIEITAGLAENEVVALDAYQRGLEDFADSDDPESSEPTEPSTTPAESENEASVNLSGAA